MHPARGDPKRRASRAQDLELSPRSWLKCPALSTRSLVILDISELGARISLPKKIRLPKVNDILNATLSVGNAFLFKLKIRIAHVVEGSMGVEFINVPDQLKLTVRNFFRPELAGASMRLSDQGEGFLRYETNDAGTVHVTLRDKEIETLLIDSPIFGEKIHWIKGAVRNEHKNRADILRFLRNLAFPDPAFRAAVCLSFT